jgi:hypothetical protein
VDSRHLSRVNLSHSHEWLIVKTGEARRFLPTPSAQSSGFRESNKVTNFFRRRAAQAHERRDDETPTGPRKKMLAIHARGEKLQPVIGVSPFMEQEFDE